MILRTALFWLCLALPIHAKQTSWPALFDVTGVASSDELNIRTAPDATAPILGTLNHDDTGIEILGASPDGRWGQINAAEGVGWVSLAFLARRAGQYSGQLPKAMACFGTEPFWSLDLASDGATYAAADGLPLGFEESSELRSRNRTDRFTRVFENDLGGLVATLANASCSDGMSDRSYGWQLDVLLVVAGDGNAQMFSGCCALVAD